MGNHFSANLFEDFGAVAMCDWAGVSGGDASFWRAVTGGSDWFAGIMPPPGTGGVYNFDYNFAASPLDPNFRFSWQTDGAYRPA